jgi:hypothetical protein
VDGTLLASCASSRNIGLIIFAWSYLYYLLAPGPQTRGQNISLLKLPIGEAAMAWVILL